MLIRFKRSDGTEYPQWEKQRLDNISNIQKGQQISEENIDKNGCYYHLNGGINPSNRTNLYNREANTISISEGGNSCGYVKWNSEKFFSGGHNYTLQNISEYLQHKYLYYFLKNIEGNIMKLRMGGALPNIQKKDISKVLIRIPCLEEQQKIADFLSTVDQKIEAQKSIVADYEELKKGTMQKIFNQEIRFKDDDGKEFPEWEEHKLSNIVNFRRGNGLSWDNITESGVNKCILYGNLYTEYKEVIKQVVFSTNENPTNCVVSRKGEVLIPASDTTATGLARASCIMLDGVILGGDINILTPKIEIMGEYLSYCINANKKQLIRIIQGSTVRHLKNEDIAKIKLFISPSIEEQKKIADCLSALDRKIEAEKKILADLEELKKGLLQGIFNN